LAISASDVTVAFDGPPVVDRVSVSVPHGTLVGVVGPNGAGKSTLFNALLGLVPLREGEVLIHGRPLDQVRGLIAYVPQREHVNWRFPLTARQVVMLGRQPHIGWLRRPGRADRQAVEDALVRVGLWDARDRLTSQLSGGQRQRAFIARALAQEAHTMLLDEAFSGVDVASQETLVAVLRELRDEGKTILIATHDLTRLAERFDTVLCLNRHVCAYGPPEIAFTPAVLEEMYGAHGAGFAYRD
jgi:manganese/zinc/iron transport system ATP- binding protein